METIMTTLDRTACETDRAGLGLPGFAGRALSLAYRAMLYFLDLETDSDFRSTWPEIIRLRA